jgi:LPXTG-motif cell wall-anchored protein
MAQNKLPQTASPLPFISLLGMGSLAAGLVGRFRK